LPNQERTDNFLAIDFETADQEHDSACSIGLVRVENNCIIKQVHYLIRPPRESFIFTPIHGIRWEDVCNEPSFSEVWEVIKPIFKKVDFIAAHNAIFDSSVLHACCRSSGFDPPRIPFECTMQLARRIWNIYPTKLPDVCKKLGIPLNHHDAASDAHACAQIIITARNQGRFRR
jgi:DNA polymerase-3 subunit epsilon